MEGFIFADRPYHPARVERRSWRRLVHKDLNHIRDMRTSLHFTTRTTLAIVAICSPLIIIYFVTPRYDLFGGVCILAATVLANLAMRWLIELWALILPCVPFWYTRDLYGWVFDPAYTFDGVVGNGNEDLDTCFHRFYQRSAFTTWLLWGFSTSPKLWIKSLAQLGSTAKRSSSQPDSQHRSSDEEASEDLLLHEDLPEDLDGNERPNPGQG